MVQINLLQNNLHCHLTYDKKVGNQGEERYADRMVVNIPVLIKANVHVVDLDAISSSVEHRASNAGFFKRFLQWKVGVISFRDLVLAGDLVEKYKAGAMSEGNFAKELSKSASNHVNINKIHKLVEIFITTLFYSEFKKI
jgi:hypothetical protein